MPSCECCWNTWAVYMDPDAYMRVVKEHAEVGCECSKDTLEGKRLRAGQWWDEENKCDKRDTLEGKP